MNPNPERKAAPMFRLLLCSLIVLAPGLAAAQTDLSLGDVEADASTPVEVSADSLNVDQATGTAVFNGNVLVVQGDIRISAASVEVFYDAEGSAITRLVAGGGVTFATATEAAEAAQADYDLATGLLILSGEVLLTQGNSALSAERMTVNLRDGTAQMDGRVRTVFLPEGE
jgi:lipopolysaccharide export system protein LptA